MNKPQITFISTQSEWDQAAKQLAASASLAVDLEGNGFFRYPERICLIQLASEDHIVLLDPLAVKRLEALEAILADPGIEKIFHSCDWDLRVLQRDLGFRVRNIFDTSIAARFLGMNQIGLGNVLKTCLEVELNKSKALQRQDWTLRPLPPESILYAADDVGYLHRLRDLLAGELRTRERWPWVREEYQRLEALTVSAPIPPEEAFWNVKGSRALAPVQRARLRELYVFRDGLAREFDRPPFKIISDQLLMDLAANPAQELEKLNGLNYLAHQGRMDNLRETLLRTAKLAGIPLPKIKNVFPSRMNAESKRRFDALKTWRQAKGTVLALDPSLLWPMRSLEFMAQHPHLRRRELERHPGSEVRAWQTEEFGGELNALFHVWDQAGA